MTGESQVSDSKVVSSSCNLIWQKQRGLSRGSLYKGTDPIPDISALMIKSPLKAPPPNTITLVVRISTWIWGDINFQAIIPVITQLGSRPATQAPSPPAAQTLFSVGREQSAEAHFTDADTKASTHWLGNSLDSQASVSSCVATTLHNP